MLTAKRTASGLELRLGTLTREVALSRCVSDPTTCLQAQRMFKELPTT